MPGLQKALTRVPQNHIVLVSLRGNRTVCDYRKG